MRKSMAPSRKASSQNSKILVSSKSRTRTQFRDLLKENNSIKPDTNIPQQLPSDYEEAIKSVLKKPFKVPIEDYVADGYGHKCLGIKRKSVRKALHNPFACNALILFEPPESTQHDKLSDNSKTLVHVVVDPILSNVLRPHQRHGVSFMYDCATGKKGDFHGCIMADEMGLGKTLQCVTLAYTLLCQSPDCKPTISKAVIVSPSSLVKNWEKEFTKWLHGRVRCLVIENGDKAITIKNLINYMSDKNQRCGTPVLIISYESFRIYSDILNASEIGMVICDEGHRLKNNDNITYQALMGLQTKRRILLSGTPIQNDLTEYFSLINFVNPGLLGTPTEFRRHFEVPISRGQNFDSTDKEKLEASEKTKELATIVNQCLIRRTNQILTKYLPVKFEMVVCVKMTALQLILYKNFLKSSRTCKAVIGDAESKNSGSVTALAAITSLKKLCNHPNLVYDKIIQKQDGFETASQYIPSNYNIKEFSPEHSGKFMVLDFMLASIKANTDDRIVLISNYTETLDLFEKFCLKRKYKFVRLDGSMSIKKRGKAVEEFNNPESDQFIFMLSSKAGGCGLNLIGANRLIMFDPDWNPANDEQAMARVWRDGQQKSCFVYRFLATASIEEKIFQRQTHKKSLSNAVVDNDESERMFTKEDLKGLFAFKEDSVSDTHEKFRCKRCINGIQFTCPPENADTTSHLAQWYHSSNNRGLPDIILSQAWTASKCVSFVFHQRTKS